MQQLPIVAIIGEPSVGKSTLLNTIAGQHLAITSKNPGTTRDRQYFDTTWNGVSFTLVDTAGLTFRENKDDFEMKLYNQVEVALAEAEAVVWVVDGQLPKSSIDQRIITKLRKAKKPVVLWVNKLDSPKASEASLAEFFSLGIEKTFAVSAISRRGLGDALDAIVSSLKEIENNETANTIKPPEYEGIKIAVVGKPNVGKSSFINHILGSDRLVVADLPGTTRTSIDTFATLPSGKEICFIDTAGLKRKSHSQTEADIFSGFQTYKSIRRSDISLLMINSIEEITKQDQHILSEIIDMKKGLIIVSNKIDQYDGEEEALLDYFSYHFSFAWFAPVFFTSATTGYGVIELLNAIPEVLRNRQKTIEQEQLDFFLQKLLKQNPPKLLRDQKQPKVYSIEQIATNPPMFELLVNRSGAISQMFRDTLKKQLIKQFDFYGTPITVKFAESKRTN